jgi:hypothetical protein
MPQLSEKTTEAILSVAQAIQDNFATPNEHDSNFESANVVDGLFTLARRLSDSFVGAVDGNLRDQNVPQGLFAIAHGLHEIANAIYSIPVKDLVDAIAPLGSLGGDISLSIDEYVNVIAAKRERSE